MNISDARPDPARIRQDRTEACIGNVPCPNEWSAAAIRRCGKPRAGTAARSLRWARYHFPKLPSDSLGLPLPRFADARAHMDYGEQVETEAR